MTRKVIDQSYRLEGVAFGLADGLIMCLGLIIGVAEATSNRWLVIITGIIGGFANSFGNSIGFYMSQSAERALQIQTTDRGKATRVHSQREIFTNSVLSFISTMAATLILISPFTFLPMNYAGILTFILGTTIAFILGGYIAKISHENPYKTGLKYAVLAILGAVISHFLADLIKMIA